jgi:hypothetical protein
MMKKQGTPTDKNHPLSDGDGCLGPSHLQNKVKGHIPLNPREKKIPLNTSPLKIKEKRKGGGLPQARDARFPLGRKECAMTN